MDRYHHQRRGFSPAQIRVIERQEQAYESDFQATENSCERHEAEDHRQDVAGRRCEVQVSLGSRQCGGQHGVPTIVVHLAGGVQVGGMDVAGDDGSPVLSVFLVRAARRREREEPDGNQDNPS